VPSTGEKNEKKHIVNKPTAKIVTSEKDWNSHRQHMLPTPIPDNTIDHELSNSCMGFFFLLLMVNCEFFQVKL